MNFFAPPFVLPPQVLAKSPTQNGRAEVGEQAKAGGCSAGGSGMSTRCCDQTMELYDSLVNRKFHPTLSPFGFFHFLTYQHTRQMFRHRRFENHLPATSRHPYDGQEISAKQPMFRGTEVLQFSPQKSIPESAFRLDDSSPSYEDQRDLVSGHKAKLPRPQSLRYSNPHHHHQHHQQQQLMFASNPFFPVFGSVEASQRNHTRHRSRIVPLPKKSFQSPVCPNVGQMEFTLKELDLVLYGFMRNNSSSDHKLAKVRECDSSQDKSARLHALSGLRVGQLSHGMDRILSGSSASGRSSFFKTDPTVLELPEGLSIERTSFAGIIHWGIFARGKTLDSGLQFGPFQGRMINTSEMKSKDDNSLMWEIFCPDGQLSHFVDGRGSGGSWMSFLNCARTSQEQNLAAYQKDGSIFYEVIKEVKPGQELLVWYDDKSYFQFLGIPVAQKAKHGRANQMAANSVNLEEETGLKTMLRTESEDSEGYQCERCGKVFAYQYYRDKHLKYTRCVDQGDRKFPCHMCSRSFEKRDRLRIHVLHVHEKHRPHKCLVCSKSFSQSSSLNKHMRVHSGERPYKCVYCSKAFTASSILRTHIRQHSGEKPFKCKHCGKAFASHAAHDSHVRRTHSKVKVACSVCGLQFNEVQDLKIHFRTHDDHLLTSTKELANSYCHGWEEPPDMNINREETLDVGGYGNEGEDYI